MAKEKASPYKKVEALFGPDQNDELIRALYRRAVYEEIIPKEMIASLFALGLVDPGGELIEDVGNVVESSIKPMGYQEPYQLAAERVHADDSTTE